MPDLFRTRSWRSQVFKSLAGAQKRLAFERVHSKRPVSFSLCRCDADGIVKDNGPYWTILAHRNIP